MIIGVGTDIVQIGRIEAILKKYGDFFKKRILTDSELKQLQKLPIKKHACFVAKRFAAKESISKALGIGIGAGLRFKDITILNNDIGQPYVHITSEGWSNFKQYKINLSLSDDYPIAIAFTVISM
jgi:holo-[acyl-carrier protein] synthase